VLLPDAVLEVEMGRLEAPDPEMGRSCRAQRRE
jgi:hypothetical protein